MFEEVSVSKTKRVEEQSGEKNALLNIKEGHAKLLGFERPNSKLNLIAFGTKVPIEEDSREQVVVIKKQIKKTLVMPL